MQRKFSFLSLTLLGCLLASFTTGRAQKSKVNPGGSTGPDRPRLVVGIVVDQMRYDYLYRYWNQYGETGFKRLLREGFSCQDAHFDYVPTYTAPGHACIYTGTTPSVNGIISNEWFDRESRKGVYCVNDTTVKPVGTTSISGKMSPHRLLTTTITDELRFATNDRSKVIALALKDRGAILPGGHRANAAYWHDPYLDNWVTSTYYMNALPDWVTRFNERKVADSLLQYSWETLLPIREYTQSTADDSPYEGKFKGETAPVFPHKLAELKKTDGELIRRTPFGNSYTFMFAKAALAGEQLGKGEETDFLAVSLSSPDYIGHQFGINSIEVQDTYLRLDRELGDFLSALDRQVGTGNYLVFLTADHGAVANPQYNDDHHVPAGFFEEDLLGDTLKKFLARTYLSDTLLLNVNSNAIYLNRAEIAAKKLSLEEVQSRVVQLVSSFPGVAVALSGSELGRYLQRDGIASLMQRGFNVQRSADVSVQLKPGWLDWYVKTGTSHGAAYSYDTHVPIVFMGYGIRPGATAAPVSVKDIAPTLAVLLSVENPNGTTGKAIQSIVERP